MTQTKPRRMRGEGGLYQRPDGLWCGQVDLGFILGKRRRRTVYARTQDAAIRKIRAVQREVEAGNLNTATLTVETWLRHWLDDIAAKTVKPRTLLTYRTYVEKHLIPVLGKKRLDRLSAQHVRELHASITSSSTTRLHAHRILSTALARAVKERKIVTNVVSQVDAPRRARSPRAGLTAEQARAVLAAAGDDRNASRWWAALLTGARQGELLGLRWEHVDLDAGVIDLAWSLQRVPYSHGCQPGCGKKRAASCPDRRLVVADGLEWEHLTGNICLFRPKTVGSRRVIPMLPAMVAALRLHKERTAAEPNPHRLVWHHADGRPIDGRRDLQAWQELLASAGVTGVTLHEARNTTATLLLEAGVDPHVIASILGHSDIVTTRGYQRVSLDLSRKAVTSLGDVLALG